MITREQVHNEIRKNLKDKKVKSKKEHKDKIEEFLTDQNATDLEKSQVSNDLESYPDYRDLEN